MTVMQSLAKICLLIIINLGGMVSTRNYKYSRQCGSPHALLLDVPLRRDYGVALGHGHRCNCLPRGFVVSLGVVLLIDTMFGPGDASTPEADSLSACGAYG